MMGIGQIQRTTQPLRNLKSSQINRKKSLKIKDFEETLQAELIKNNNSAQKTNNEIINEVIDVTWYEAGEEKSLGAGHPIELYEKMLRLLNVRLPILNFYA